MAKKWYQGLLIKVQNENPTTRRFWIKVEEEAPFFFRAGQFVTMDLPIGETRLDRWRSYSIANAPDTTNVLEFCITKLQDGRAGKYFFEDINPGQSIRFKGPDGVFTLGEKKEKELVFICTGTGVAPFRSMIHDLIRQGVSLPKIHLIFGTRHLAGVLYRKEFEQLARKHPSFQYSVALSRDEAIKSGDVEFNLYHGYVHQIYEQLYQKKHKNITFYLCGWSNMVDEAQKKLTANLGYAREQLIVELYG